MVDTKEGEARKRCLITGGAGFIGSHLCEYLLARGFYVICMDSLLTGAVANIVRLHSERFEFIKHDVTNYIYIDGPIDYIFHLASPASPVDFERLPIPILKVGALGTHKVLGLAKAKEARFLLASTSEVYGDPLSDMVDGLYRLMMSDVTEPVNIGNPQEMTVFELAKTILELTGNHSEILFKPLPVDDPRVRQPDISRARTLLGWEPQVSLAEGLQHTIAYFRAALA
jgi:nucleoside-diphosphate-sugar epimerase